MTLTDEIIDILYRNEENGYSVVRLKNSNSIATGVFVYTTIGQELAMSGEWVNNAKYGKQFKVGSYEVLPPNTPKKIAQFLGSGLIYGVGPATADKIVKHFGNKSLEIISEHPHELSVISGISDKKAKKIGEDYAEVKQLQAIVLFLQKFDLSINMCLKIHKYYGNNAIEKINQNPYQLIETISGIGFITADKMARDLGIDYKGTFRVRAGAVYCLIQSAEQDGHTYLPREKLLLEACKLLRIKMEELVPVFDNVIYDLLLDKYLTKVSDGYMLTRYFVDEKAIAARVSVLSEWNGDQILESEKLLRHYQEINNIVLHELQINAIKSAINRGICIITGGPGTGKTTIIRAILYLNNAAGLRTVLLAPTGRAAKRLEETTGESASTIHRALIDKDGTGDTQLATADVVVIDEFSMCDVPLAATLLKELSPHTRVVIVGDIDQLPSVGPGRVLADLIESEVVDVIKLSEVYRQDEQSQIVVSAHRINKGEMPDLTNKSRDFFFEACSGPVEIKQKVVALVTSRVPGYLGVATNRIQVLCPMKAGEAGMNAMNLSLQESINPPSSDKSELEYGQTVFRLCDRVMNVKNNYQQEWRNPNGVLGKGIFNGDIGTITEIRRASGEVVVELEDGRVTTYTRSDLNNLVLSYAITVHKSQGSEFDVAVIPVTSGAYMILTRNLLYTAVTRAKKMVVLVGSASNVEKMVNNTFTKKRHTMLKELIQKTQ